MARPRKYTVEYFPHICKQGKTMYILESRWGNDGYSFWFKLLELLASSEGHYFDTNNISNKEFFGAKTKVSSEKMGEILDLLAEIDAIDKDLWVNHKIVWCQKLVDNVSDVYASRTSILPEKPYYQDGILQQNIDNHKDNAVFSPKTPQTKLKETKLKETKRNNKEKKTNNRYTHMVRR